MRIFAAAMLLALCLVVPCTPHAIDAPSDMGDRQRERPERYGGKPFGDIFEDMPSISEAIRLEGVGGYVEGAARESVRYLMSTEGSSWLCDAFAEAINRRRRGEKASSWLAIFRQDPEMKEAVKVALKERIKDRLPGVAKDVIVNRLLGGAIGEEHVREAEELANRIIAEMDLSMNDRVDALVDGMYDMALDGAIEYIKSVPGLSGVDITDMRGTLARAFSAKNIGDLAADGLARIMGDGTVNGIRRRVTDALRGNLPPELVGALEAGPEAFDKYISEAGKYLPGQMLNNIRDSVFNRPIIKLPTPTYAAILSASAAGHFTKAFSGPFVDPMELKRGVEVTRVMIWQIRNKESINLSIMQIGAFARGVAEGFGAGAAVDGLVQRVSAPIDRIQDLADRIDGMIMKPIEEVRGQLAELVGSMRQELSSLQDYLTAPIKTGIAEVQGNLDNIRDAIEKQLPENFDGIPATWDDMKDVIGLKDGPLGEIGDLSPADALAKVSESLGLDDAAEKIGRDFAEVNDVLSGHIAQAASDVLYAAHLIGPAAAIMDSEKVPAKNESKSMEMDPVLMHNGEYYYEATDLVIPGKGIDFRFTRIYRTRSDFTGELGRRWTHSYAERLLPWNGGYTHIDDRGRKFHFVERGGEFISPPGVYSKLVRGEENFLELHHQDGSITAFDSDGRISSKADRDGNRFSFRYDGGLLSSVIDTNGREIRVMRRGDGLISAIVDPVGRTFTFEYDDRQELIGVATPPVDGFPKGKRTVYEYSDVAGGAQGMRLLAAITDPRGNVYLRNIYDAEGRVVAQRYGDSPWMTVRYEPEGRTIVKDALDIIRMYEHDAEGHLVKLSRIDGEMIIPRISYSYDADGEVEKECWPSGYCRRLYYGHGEDAGEVVRMEEYPSGGGEPRSIEIKADDVPAKPATAVAEYRYSPAGNVVEIEYEDGREEKFMVNSLNQVVHEEISDDYPRDYHFDANDNLVKVEIAMDGRTITHEFEYDVLDRQTISRLQASPDKFIETRMEYDAAGRLKSVKYPEGNVDEYEYDADGNLKCEVRGATSLERSSRCYEYDSDGLVVATVDGNGARTVIERDGFGGAVAIATDSLSFQPEAFGDDKDEDIVFDADDLGRIVAVHRDIDGVDAVTRYGWDGNGRLTSVEDALGNTTRFAYDSQDRIVAEIYPDSTERKISYDGDGNAVGIIDRDGDILKMSYDVAGRLIERSTVSAVGKRGVHQRFTYDGEGRLIYAEDGDAKVRISYDSVGRPVAEESGRGWLQRGFDDLGREVVLRYPDGSAFHFIRDEDGKVLSILGDSGRIASFGYDGDGRYVHADLGDNLQLDIQRDIGGRVMTIDYARRIDVLISRFEARRDEGGEVLADVEPHEVERRYARDSAGRLIGASEFGGHSEDEDDGPIADWSYDLDPLGAILMPSGVAQYDKGGNLISYGGYDFSYDSMDRLIAVSRGGETVASYEYDAFNRRRDLLWDGWQAIADGGSKFIYGPEQTLPVAMVADGTTEYLMGDRLGSARGIVGAAGDVTGICDYDPIGAEMDCDSARQPFCFAGHICDDMTGLIYMRNRYYHPGLGSFMTPDPIGYKISMRAEPTFIIVPSTSYHRMQGGASRATFPNSPNFIFGRMFRMNRAPFLPGEMNLYMYARGDPTRFADPLGLASLLFDRSDKRMYLYDGKGFLVTEYIATNRTTKPNADPLVVGANGPFPEGTYSIGVPEFYSEEYRDDIYRRFDLGAVIKGESYVTGPDWLPDSDDTPEYSARYGRMRFRAGSARENDIAWRRWLFLHGGRHDYKYQTRGCIRADDEELETLAANFIAFRRQGDAVETITVRE